MNQDDQNEYSPPENTDPEVIGIPIQDYVIVIGRPLPAGCEDFNIKGLAE